MLHHRTPPRARAGAETGSRGPCFTNLVFTVALSPRRRDAASFDSGPLFSAFRPTQSRFPPKRANAVVAVVSVVPVHRARGIDVADVVRVGRYKPHPKKNAGRYRRGVIPLFCCSAANRSLSCFLHFAVMFFTFITCRVHSAHCSEEISSFSKESSIRKRTVLHSVSAFSVRSAVRGIPAGL